MTLIQDNYISVLVLLGLALVGLLIPFWVIKSIGTPRRRKKGKNINDLSAFVAYECGEVPIGEAHTRFNFQYFVFAITFVIFDIITAFMFPWSIVIKSDLLANGMIAAISFMGVFLIGFGYWWKRDALRWM